MTSQPNRWIVLATIGGVLAAGTGCQTDREYTARELLVTDLSTGQPVAATAIVLRADPRHPLSVNDLLREDAFERRTYRGNSEGKVRLRLDQLAQEHILVAARGYVPLSLEGPFDTNAAPMAVVLRPLASEPHQQVPTVHRHP